MVDEIPDFRAYLCIANHPTVLVLVHVAHCLSVCTIGRDHHPGPNADPATPVRFFTMVPTPPMSVLMTRTTRTMLTRRTSFAFSTGMLGPGIVQKECR